MFDNAYIFFSSMLSVIALGWISFGYDEKPLPLLIKPTPWKCGAEKSPIVKFSVSPAPYKMYDLVTEDKKHILFFDTPERGNILNWDVGEHNDIPRVTFKTRLVPPRNVETEMTIHVKIKQQLEDLRVPEREMYSYLLREQLETI